MSSPTTTISIATPRHKRSLTNNASKSSPIPRKRKRNTSTARSQQFLATIELLNDLGNFCGVGTIDIPMPRRAAVGMEAPDGWFWLETPGRSHQFPKQSIQAKMIALVEAGWLRCTYQMIPNTQSSARVRIYVLPDDLGRTYIKREDTTLRKCLRTVVSATDDSKQKWKMSESPDCERQEIEETASLFYMFNKLKSPAPDPGSFWIKDENTKELINDVLTRDLPGVKTTLYRHQKRTVAMMLQKELAPEQTMDPRLTSVHGPDEGVYFHDFETTELFQDPRYFEDVKGGILAEEMGTGAGTTRKPFCKTLVCLALILATKSQISFTPDEYEQPPQVRPAVGSLMSMCIASIWRNAIPWKQYSGTDQLPDNCEKAILDSHGYYEIQPPVRSRSSRYDTDPALKEKIYLGSGTIIVCPQNLVEQWQGEIEKHLEKDALNVLTCGNSKDQIPTIQELLKYDVIIFSRSRFDKEAREGLDQKGRRESGGKPLICTCPYMGATRTPNCTCFRKEDVYKSPLMSIHWKRLIVDEGHSMASGSKTNSVLVADKLPVERRWIVTGTPTSELVGIMTGTAMDSVEDQEAYTDKLLEDRKETKINEAAQLERVGKMVCDFLKQEPWTLSQWKRYMNPTRMKSMLEKFFIRHTAKDITFSVELPPLYQKDVPLEPSYFDKISMNLLIGALAVNAVTSERSDKDYMFHKDNKANLRKLTDNLLKRAGFYWSGYSPEDIESHVKTSRKYRKTKKCTPEDRALLEKSIAAGETALKDPTWRNITTYHEMVYFLADFPNQLTEQWGLIPGATPRNGFHEIGGAQIQNLQKSLNAHSWLEYDALILKLKALGQAFHNTRDSKHHPQPNTDPHHAANTPKTPPPTRPRFPDLSTMPALAKPHIVGTASKKLTYLVTAIRKHHTTEKTLVFYEDQDTAWYLTQALELLGIETLAYSPGLSPAQKSLHLRTFQHSDKYRILVMDLRQAAHGLNVCAASRVYFINPVWRGDVERQAVKRAHRIGQTREVYVETLYLKGTVEEAVLARRREMSERERGDAKTLVDDEAMCEIIRKWEFLPIVAGEEKRPACMLEDSEPLFGHGKHGGVYDQVEGLPGDPVVARARVKREMASTPKRKRTPGAEEPPKRKRHGFMGSPGRNLVLEEEEDGNDSGASGASGVAGAKVVRFA
ncbi:uncharacterized protein LAJ45_09628 [Morchella importuna]|uniref:uncharacterized protein n=1 Tax=Morchella importuna TaxID=1174673 RepID=UPI001E8D14F1|nr:uncharacterized protein LAJ45_09628 [Morchella importuna]KAH8146435.1 hypothetical protein LAJ45_09628 [Morchella importuna]